MKLLLCNKTVSHASNVRVECNLKHSVTKFVIIVIVLSYNALPSVFFRPS
jgi:hypothetical protein